MNIFRNKKAGEKILETYDLLLSQWDTDKEELDIPSRYGTTHVILCGGKDALLRHRMNARFFPGVGHGINHEIAGEINKAIVEYF